MCSFQSLVRTYAGHCHVCCAHSLNDVIEIIQHAQTGQAFCVLLKSTNVHCIKSLKTRVFYVRFQSFFYLFTTNRATFSLTSRLPILTSTDAILTFRRHIFFHSLASHNIHNFSAICHLIGLKFYHGRST